MRLNKEALRAEELRLKRLRRIVDLNAVQICQTDLTLSDAKNLSNDARVRDLELFPD